MKARQRPPAAARQRPPRAIDRGPFSTASLPGRRPGGAEGKVRGIGWHSPLVRLAVFGAVSLAIYVFAFSAAYSIQGGIEKPLLHFGRITGPSVVSTLGYAVAVGALFALYLAAIQTCRQLEGRRSAYAVMLGVGVLCSLALLPMYPVFSLDIFYYMAADRIWSVYRENPFVVPPLQAAHDPFFPYTTWGHYTLPYGPLWPWISALTSAPGQGQLGPTLLGFKTLGVLGYLLCLPAVLWAVGGLRPDRRLTGTCIFAWNPLVLLELAGGGHNDAIALVPAALALGLWARRASIGMAITLALSFVVKATVSIMAAPLVWTSFRQALASRRLPWWLGTHALPAAVLVALAWLPFWSPRSTGGLAREAEQYYQSLTAVVMAAVPAAWEAPALKVLQVVLLGVFGLYFLTQRRALAAEKPTALHATWRIVVLYFLLVAPFYSGWYMVWPTLLAAVLVERRVTLLTTLLCIGGLATYLVQFVVRPLTVPTLGWAQLNGLSMLVAFGPFLIGWWVLRPSRVAARPD